MSLDLERRVQVLEEFMRRRETDSKATAFGTWTPTLRNTTNIDSSTSAAGWYIRVGSKVVCGVRIEIDATAATATVIGISLPVASNIGAAGDVVGTIASRPGGSGHVNGDSTNDEATAGFNALLTTNQAFYVTFIYTII